ncbi:lipid-transfer protein [Streptomyces plumbiresistens]|uniref:propanoyl-CoA C-acyltransferase n=1 Tax=Streptomyces plumbiresistens TaxID=511811 RepID=A0ABP7TEJ5_9ACTN
MSAAVVAGVGMIPFTTPRRTETYDVMGEKALRAALTDAGIEYGGVEQVYAGYVYGDSTSGQVVAYRLGLTGVPVINVNNNCSTGSTALYLARQAVENAAADVVVAVGFEQMRPGSLSLLWDDRPTPMASFDAVVDTLQPRTDAPFAAQFFGGGGREYCERYGMDPRAFAEVAVKSRRHAAQNPYAVFRDPLTVDEVLASPHVYGPLTRLMCCPPTCGAAAAVLVSAEYARRHGIADQVVIAAQALTTDTASTFDPGSMMAIVGAGMTRAAADQVYERAGIGPEDVPVVELHDCFTTNEVLSYEALRLTPEGTAEKFIADGDNTYGGRVVTNPSGGLMSKGHPLGATGLAQCAELVWQLRGQAGDRQVEGARVALQHNIGLGGAAVVTLYERRG